MVNTLSQNWWTLVLRGLAAVLFGIWAFVWPDITFTVLVLLFGAYALWDGVFALIGAFRTKGEKRWMLILEGVVGIVMGLVTFLWPGAATLALLTIIAAWAIITGIFEIIAAIRLRAEIEGEWFMMLSGLLSVLFGIALAVWPVAGLVAVTWMIGSYAIIFGILMDDRFVRHHIWDSVDHPGIPPAQLEGHSQPSPRASCLTNFFPFVIASD